MPAELQSSASSTVKICQLFLQSASYLPIVIYPGASFLFRVLVSLKAFAEGLRYFASSAGPTQLIHLLTPSHPLTTLCISFYQLTPYRFYSILVWAFVDDLEPREKLLSHQPPSSDFKQEFIYIVNSSTISSSTTLGLTASDPGE